MSEQFRPPLENQFNHLECDSIDLVYNEELLEAIDIEVASPGIDPYIPLAQPNFDYTSTKHIESCEFGLRYYGSDDAAAKGHITYSVDKMNPHNAYDRNASVLVGLVKYVESQTFFTNYGLFFEGTVLRVENALHSFRFTVTNSPFSTNEVTVKVEMNHDIARPAELIHAAQAWAYMCSYVMRLGAEPGNAATRSLPVPVALGELLETPSDIEIALIQEIEKRRDELGETGTLPSFSYTDILPRDIQGLVTSHDITTEEIARIANDIVDKKRAEYAMFDIMTSITQSDIVDALRKAVQSRKPKM